MAQSYSSEEKLRVPRNIQMWYGLCLVSKEITAPIEEII